MSENVKRRPGGGGAAETGATNNVTAASPQPKCAICDRRAGFSCRHRCGINRLQVHPIPGFAVADLDPGDLLTRADDGIWCIERIPPDLTPSVLTAGPA